MFHVGTLEFYFNHNRKSVVFFGQLNFLTIHRLGFKSFSKLQGLLRDA